MKRDPLSDMLLLYGDSRTGGGSLQYKREGDFDLSQDEEGEEARPVKEIDHDLARQLILDQSHRLLPADEANALADHLLVCDKCFRFAQDIAHQERQSGKHQAIQGTTLWRE